MRVAALLLVLLMLTQPVQLQCRIDNDKGRDNQKRQSDAFLTRLCFGEWRWNEAGICVLQLCMNLYSLFFPVVF